MEVDPNVVGAIVTALSRSNELDQTVQADVYRVINEMRTRPDFLPCLLMIVRDDLGGCGLMAAVQMRVCLNEVSSDVLEWLVKTAPEILVGCLSRPSLPFVRQVSALIGKLMVAHGCELIPGIGGLCVELLGRSETQKHAFVIAYELAASGIDLGAGFATAMVNFIVPEFCDAVTELANVMAARYGGIFAEGMIPRLLGTAANLSEESLVNTILLLGQVAIPPVILVEFLVSCFCGPERVALTAARVLRRNREIPFHVNFIGSLFARIGDDPDVTNYCLSLECMECLKVLIRNNDEGASALGVAVNASLRVEGGASRALRGIAVMQETLSPSMNVDEMLGVVGSFVNTPYRSDAVYCLTSIALRHESHRTVILERMFEILMRSSPDVRVVIEFDIVDVLCVMRDVTPEPFLGMLLGLMKNVVDSDEEFTSVCFLLGVFCGVVSTLEGNPNVDDLMSLAIRAFGCDDAKFAGSMHLFGKIVAKCPSKFSSIIGPVGERVIKNLDNVDDISLTQWLWIFLANSVMTAQMTGVDATPLFVAAVRKLPFYLSFDSSDVVRECAWQFVIAALDTVNVVVLDAMMETVIRAIMDTPDNESASVFGLIGEAMLRIIAITRGNLDPRLVRSLMAVLCIGIKATGEGGGINSERLLCAILKLFPLYEEAMDADVIGVLTAVASRMENGSLRTDVFGQIGTIFAAQASKPEG